MNKSILLFFLFTLKFLFANDLIDFNNESSSDSLEIFQVQEAQFISVDQDTKLEFNKLYNFYGKYHINSRLFIISKLENSKQKKLYIYLNRDTITSLFNKNRNTIEGNLYFIVKEKKYGSSYYATPLKFIEYQKSEFNQDIKNFYIKHINEIEKRKTITNERFDKIKDYIKNRILKDKTKIIKKFNKLEINSFSKEFAKKFQPKIYKPNLKDLNIEFNFYSPMQNIIIFKNQDIRLEPRFSYQLYRYLQLYIIYDLELNSIDGIIVTIKGEFLE